MKLLQHRPYKKASDYVWKLFILQLGICHAVIQGQDIRSPSYVHTVLQELLIGPLLGHSVLLYDDVIDTGQLSATENVDWTRVSNEQTSLFHASAGEYELPKQLLYTYSGSNFTTIWIINSEQFTLDDVIGDPKRWCPQQLLILNYKRSVTKDVIFETKVTHCAKFVALIDINNDKQYALVYSSLPLEGNRPILLGRWNASEFQSKDSLFRDRFETFSSTVLQLASFCDDYPLLYPAEETCIGSNIDVLTVIGSHLNFTFSIQMITPDENWGSKENGTWTGMLADLVSNGKHLIINYFLVNLERFSAFDSTYPYHAEGFGFLAHLPKPLPKWNALILPYTGEMWISILAVTIFMGFLFAGLTKIRVGETASNLQLSRAVLTVSNFQLQFFGFNDIFFFTFEQ